MQDDGDGDGDDEELDLNNARLSLEPPSQTDRHHAKPMTMSASRYKLVFFSPIASNQSILSHLFQRYPSNIGRIGNYENCAFVTQGTGQFRPISGANPSIGAVGQLEHVQEHRVEIVVKDEGGTDEIKGAVKELIKVSFGF